MFGIGFQELLVIFLILLIFFGGAKLPEFARSMGKAMRAFKDEANSLRRELETAETPATAPPTSPPPPSTETPPPTVDIEGKAETKR